MCCHFSGTKRIASDRREASRDGLGFYVPVVSSCRDGASSPGCLPFGCSADSQKTLSCRGVVDSASMIARRPNPALQPTHAKSAGAAELDCVMPHATERQRTDEAASNRPSEFGTWTFFESGLQRGRRQGNRSVS